MPATRLQRRRARRLLPRPLPRSLPLSLILALSSFVVTACNRAPAPDAYGTFEATEVVVSSQTSGPVQRFTPVEGMRLDSGALVALVDTAALVLERRQLDAQRAAVGARGAEAGEQLHVLEVQRDIAQRSWERTRRLHAEQAATAQQLDQAEREYRVLGAQIAAVRAQRQSVGMDVQATTARVAQVDDRLARSAVVNPTAGTVLATYVRPGEMVQAGQPLYRIAALDTLTLRAYVGEAQLAAFRLGQRVTVRVDRGDGLLAVPGVVTWVSAKAEFTPTPVQTRDERDDLVYAIKVRVPNAGGALKIGMPADLTLGDAVVTTATGTRP